MKTINQVNFEMFLELLPRSKRKRILFLLSKNTPVSKESNDNVLSKINLLKKSKYRYESEAIETDEMYQLLSPIFDQEVILKFWQKIKFDRYRKRKVYQQKPAKKHKDNSKSDTCLYPGPATTIVRFPKKNRSKRTWNNFWTLFPAFKGFYSLEEWKKEKWKESRKQAAEESAKWEQEQLMERILNS